MPSNVIEDDDHPSSIVTSAIARPRLLAGLLQGLALYLLYVALKSNAWPATNGYVFAPLLLTVLFVPILFVSGIGHLPKLRLWIWITVAAVVLAVLGLHDIWRQGLFETGLFIPNRGVARVTPSGALFVIATVGLYIAHALVLAATADQRRIARYNTYFELAWKLIIQIIFSLVFVGVLWMILWLGSALFMLVKLTFLNELIRHAWFVVPVTVFAFATALHVTDVRPGIVRGIRNLLLVLNSWLLPVTVLIVGGFLFALPFTGIGPLWATRHATSVLLAAAAVLIMLVNATFQAGKQPTDVARVLRIAARAACGLLLPITLIAVYSLTLRVEQHGWTTDRIVAASCLLVAVCYAVGYLWAALERDTWLARIAPINVITSFIILAIMFMLFTPIADPARLSVANQLARWEAGKTDARKFDFEYLRFEGARYGNDALQTFRSANTGPDAELISKRAEAALQKKNKWDSQSAAGMTNAGIRAATISVWPKGAVLPKGFVEQDWGSVKADYRLPPCLTSPNSRCDAYLVDLNADGATEVLLKNEGGGYAVLVIFSLQSDGAWKATGTLEGGDIRCKSVVPALGEGRYQLAAPLFKDVLIGGQRLRVQPWPSEKINCDGPAIPQ